MAYTSKYTGEEIDAKLDEVKPVDIVDGLESDDSASALSARQGKVLKEMIEGGITEEKEVYIGEGEPTDDGAKLWIDPQGTPSGGNGGGTTGGGGSNVFVFPEEVMSDDYNVNNPYFFSKEKMEEFLAAIENPTSVYILYQTDDSDNVLSLPISISLTPMGFTASYVALAQYAGTTYLGGGLIIFVFSQDGSLGAYTTKVSMKIS